LSRHLPPPRQFTLRIINSEIKIITLPVRRGARRTKSRAAHCFANAVPCRLAHRDNFLSKEVGEVPGVHTPPTLSPFTAGPLGGM
jgi:hypothetical protein